MLEANPLALVPLLCCAVGARVALLSFRRSPGLVAASLGAVVWNACVAVAACLTELAPALWMTRLSLAAALVIAAGVMSVLTEVARPRHRRAWLAAGICAAGAGVLVVLLDSQVFPSVRPVPWGGHYGVAGPHLFVPLILIGAILGSSFGLGLRVWSRMAPSRRRRQLAHVLWGFGIAVLGSVDVAAVLGVDLPPVGWATSIVSLGLVYTSFAHRRLIDVRTALSRTRFWVVLILGTFLILLALLEATEGWDGWGILPVRALALVGLALLGARIERRLGRMLRNRRASGAARVRAFADQTRSPSTPVDVLLPLARALDGLGLDLVAVALPIEGGDGPAAEWHVLEIDRAPRQVAAPGPLPAALVAREDLEPGVAQDWLEAFAAEVVVPLRHRRDPVGAILLRSRRPAGFVDEESRGLLEKLAARAAVAFTNATLHDRLERRAAYLQHEVDERTRSLVQSIADRRAAQARLVQAEKQSALALLVAGVSHEINNALNFIYANAPMLGEYAGVYDDLLARAGAGPEARAAAARLRRGSEQVAGAARRIRVLVEDLRHFARSDDSARRPTDLGEAARAAVKLLAAQIHGRIEVVWRGAEAPEGSTVVDAFATALYHGVLALVLNAVQAVGEGGTVTIELALTRGGVRLAVTDDGPGIPEADREAAFEPFTTTRPGAAGLGLTSARAAAHRHGGSLTLEAGPGGSGTRAVLIIPASGDR